MTTAPHQQRDRDGLSPRDTAEPDVPGGSRPARTVDGADRGNRILLVVAAVASVVPYFWAAVRDVRNGFYPSLDVAATVLRARDVFSSHPPLVGMWSSGSTWAGNEIHFPGAIQLYLLAVPTQLLGNAWGPLLTMAALNAGWVLLAGWLVYRRFGTNAALLAFACLTAFMWSIGSENLIDPRPMEMVTIPFLCFLFAVWVVADGDIDALPALAVVANFLFLDHLVQALQIPVIGLCAVVGLVVWFRRNRRLDAAARDPAFPRLRRRVIQTAVITVVMWLPSLIEQVTSSPGNLWALVRATGEHREPVGSFVVGYTTVFRLIGTPPFWFRGRFAQGRFHRGLDQVGVADVLAGVVVVAVLVTLVIVARRRGDRTVVALVGVTAVGIAVSILTVVQSPAIWGFLPYLRSVWALAAFVWFVALFGFWRLFGATRQRQVARLAGVGAVVFCLFGLSYADFGAMTDVREGVFAKQMVDATVPQLTGRGPVLVRSAPDFESERYFTSLLLGLDTAGVHYCVEGIAVGQFGSFRDCGDRAEVVVLVRTGDDQPDVDGVVLSVTPQLSPTERARLETAVRVGDEWLATHDRVRLTPYGRQLAIADASGLAPFEPDDGDLRGLLEEPTFRLFLQAQATHQRDPNRQEPVFDEPDFPVEAMLVQLEFQGRTDPVVVYELPGS